MTIQHFHRTLYRAALFVALAVPIPLAAQQAKHAADQFPRYAIEDLGTLGGQYSFTYSLNDAGVVTGGAATGRQTGDPTQAVVNAPQTAVSWDRGRIRNLGSLGGSRSGLYSAGAATNLFNIAAVDSETTNSSRQGEDVCGFGTHLQCLAAIWNNGRLTALPLLDGGNNSYAADLNDRGQTVGFSDTGVYDPQCGASTTAGFQFQPVIWQPSGRIRQLTPLDGDTVGFAFGINNSGQTVGGSGACGNTTAPPYVSAPHAVLWEPDGTSVDLGSLGGPVSIATTINSRGDVAGTSSTTDGSPQPFLWTPESRTMLPLTPPDGFPIAITPCCRTINDRREIVGFMLDTEFNSHAFLWKKDVMVDLNDLIREGSPWMLQGAYGINAAGQIAGQGLINGEVHAFLATPCSQEGGRGKSCGGWDH